MRGEAKGPEDRLRFVLVARKGAFGLPTACPSCLPVYLYLRLASVPFDLQYDVKNPDSDHIPFVELGDYVAYGNEKGGVINGLKDDGIVDLDSKLSTYSFPDWLSMKAMVCSWLVDAALFELWVDSDGSAADTIYFSDLPWPIGKLLHWKQSRDVKNKLGITKANTVETEEEVIYRKAKTAYEALSSKLGDQTFFFENRPTSLDAIFLGHSLFVLQTLPETSALRNLLLKHDNLVKYSEKLKKEFLEASSSSSTIPRSSFESSTSSTSGRGFSSHWTWSSKPKPKPKRERTEEEKTFRRRAKYFLATQLVAVVVFLTLFGPSSGREELEMGDDGDDDLDYDY
ncbi:hypothetical protein Taro_013652 [Colocasia esculenta]|uniref:Metaxin n=1 Tax=Colocasia esculenta TaxID=4460 RepID=A0A843UCN0_COLES|nr:hypothetical protein [Colocasia esculenta]